MNIKSKIKTILGKYPTVQNLVRVVYIAIMHPDRLERKKHFGELNNNKTIYVIRPNTDDGVQGLMSLFVQALRKIDYAKRMNYIPYVDFKKYKTQYSDGKDNAWEYFFRQPVDCKYEEVYKSKNVILSGASLVRHEDLSLYKGSIFFNGELCRKAHEIITDNIKYSSAVMNLYEAEDRSLNVEDCLGIYMRGTDYVKLKPTGEYVQPNIEEVIKKINEFSELYNVHRYFLVTEDFTYYSRLKTEYGNDLHLVSYDSFIKDYDGQDFLSKSGVLKSDKKARGMEYLVKILLLSQCKYLVSSITFGSIAAYAINGGKYEDKYIFDLGLYK